MKRLFILLISLFVFSASFFYSEETTEKWTLATEEFELAQKQISDLRLKEFSTLFPSLILENIISNVSRMVPHEEMVDRKLSELQTERLSLFLQLTKEVKTRDSYVVTKETERELKKAIKESKEKIQEIQDKIKKNLQEVKKVREKGLVEEDDARFLFFPIFAKERKEYEMQAEKVALYKDSVTSIFKATDNALMEGKNSYAYEKEINNAKINGIITGKIIIYGDYTAVTVEMKRFPGNETIATITEVGLVTDPIEIARNIAENLVPKIVNSLPVLLKFNLKPQAAAENCSVTIDDTFYPHVPADLILDGGIHTLTFESSGYRSQSVTYNFSRVPEFVVDVKLEESKDKVFTLKLKKYQEGTFYANGIDFGKSDETKPVEINVNGKTVMGIFAVDKLKKNEDGDDEIVTETAFFHLNENKLKDGANYTMNLKPMNREQNIDKRRKMMYTAFTALICSLPVTFYCLGNNNINVEAYNMKRISFEEANAWRTATYISEGVSAACGVWFAFELVRYLIAANEVLPKEP